MRKGNESLPQFNNSIYERNIMETNETNEKIFLLKQYKNWDERFSSDCIMREVFVKVNKDVTNDDFYNENVRAYFFYCKWTSSFLY